MPAVWVAGVTDIDKDIQNLHGCLLQYERAMGELGWSMLNVNPHAALDRLAATARRWHDELDDADDRHVAETAYSAKQQERAETAEADRDRYKAALQDELDNWNPEARPTISAERDRLARRVEQLETALQAIEAWHPSFGLGYEGPRNLARAALTQPPTEPQKRPA